MAIFIFCSKVPEWTWNWRCESHLSSCQRNWCTQSCSFERHLMSWSNLSLSCRASPPFIDLAVNVWLRFTREGLQAGKHLWKTAFEMNRLTRFPLQTLLCRTALLTPYFLASLSVKKTSVFVNNELRLVALRHLTVAIDQICCPFHLL